MKHTTQWDMEYWMNSNGFFVGFNTPAALESQGKGDNETSHRLPPYEKRKFFLVDEYPACPKDWMISEGKLSSFFVPVKEGQGMWLDFNKNSDHKHHLAIVISVQGINPITGLPCNDPQLEQYAEECPKCKVKFGPNRFCKKCGYKWPKQNYICTTGTPNGCLWLDGFRAANGVVRQYILTQEKMKGVANNIIGKDRVFAIGISFFLSKNPKPIEQQRVANRGPMVGFYSPIHAPLDLNDNSNINILCGTTTGSHSYGPAVEPVCHFATTKGHQVANSTGKKRNKGSKGSGGGGASCSMAEIETANAFLAKKCNDPNMVIECGHSFSFKTPVQVKKLEVGAGAKIDQMVYDDPEPLDFWRDKPEAVICINYADENACEKIIKAGKVSLEGHKEAFLKEIPVGN